MRKQILAATLLLALASCDKKGNTYSQDYSVIYLKHVDSFYARAGFCKIAFGTTPLAELGRKEWVTFNGQVMSVASNNAYVASGTGKPDGTFELDLKKRKYYNSIPAAILGNIDFIFPDTISIALGFTIKLIRNRGLTGTSITIYDGTGNALGPNISVDSAVVYPESIANFTPGKKDIVLYESLSQQTPEYDQEMGGWMSYNVEYKKTIVFVP